MTADQAKDFGLIDKVIKSRDEAEAMLTAVQAGAGASVRRTSPAGRGAMRLAVPTVSSGACRGGKQPLTVLPIWRGWPAWPKEVLIQS